METCKKNKRKVALFGRSMENMVDVALKCGYFKDKDIVNGLKKLEYRGYDLSGIVVGKIENGEPKFYLYMFNWH